MTRSMKGSSKSIIRSTLKRLRRKIDQKPKSSTCVRSNFILTLRSTIMRKIDIEYIFINDQSMLIESLE